MAKKKPKPTSVHAACLYLDCSVDDLNVLVAEGKLTQLRKPLGDGNDPIVDWHDIHKLVIERQKNAE